MILLSFLRYVIKKMGTRRIYHIHQRHQRSLIFLVTYLAFHLGCLTHCSLYTELQSSAWHTLWRHLSSFMWCYELLIRVLLGPKSGSKSSDFDKWISLSCFVEIPRHFPKKYNICFSSPLPQLRTTCCALNSSVFKHRCFGITAMQNLPGLKCAFL